MSINNVPNVRADINEMLSKIRDLSGKTSVFAKQQVTPATGFDNIMAAAKGAFQSVNQMRTTSEAMKDAYVAGDRSVSMAQVVVASQKSKVAFEGLMIVRNKLLEAYKEIMNMPL
ncbi:MAG: flagellar hook-basal body complex protein FliE [Gammaproteobacteria bacterium]